MRNAPRDIGAKREERRYYGGPDCIEHKLELTPKQIAFCRNLVFGNMTRVEAYRDAYGLSPKTTRSRLETAVYKAMRSERVKQYLDYLHGEVQRHLNMTAEDLIRELEEARQLALQLKNPKVMVTSTLGKAKILGIGQDSKGGDKGDELIDLFRSFAQAVKA